MVVRSELTRRVERIAKEFAAEAAAVRRADRRLLVELFAKAYSKELAAIEGDAEMVFQRWRTRL